MHKQRMALMLAAAAGIVASFLPWASVMGISVNGTAGAGWISLLLFAVIAIMSLLGNRTMALKGGLMIAAIIAAVLVIILGIWQIMDIKKEGGGFVEIGFGLYIVVAAGAGCLLLPFVIKGGESSNAA